MSRQTETRSRAWCFTLNNPSDEAGPYLNDVFSKDCAYLVYQKEKGESGTVHYQGYFYFNNARRFSAVKKALPDAHLEAAKGSPIQNRDYCTKDEGRLDGPFEFGDLPAQGKRTDIEGVVSTIKAGGSLKRVAEEHPAAYIRYHRGIQALHRALDSRERDWQTELWVFYGPPGTGKSRTATALGRETGSYTPIIGNSGIWWDGYDAQHTIILDEFKCNVPLALFKRMADRYPLKIDVKGGSSEFLSRRIIITTNLDPDNWYSGERVTDDERRAVLRRITFRVFFGQSGRLVELDDRSEKTDLPLFENQ